MSIFIWWKRSINLYQKKYELMFGLLCMHASCQSGEKCGFDTFSSVTRELDPFIHGTLFIKCLYFRLSFFTLFIFPGIHHDMISAHMPFACIILRNKIIFFLKLLSSLEIYFLFVYVFFYQKLNWWQLKEKLKRRQRKWQAVYIWILCCMEHTV